MKRSKLLVVTAFCFCVSVAADTQSGQKGGKTLSEKDGILQLEKGNFNRALKKYKQLLVHFCKLPTKTHMAGFIPETLDRLMCSVSGV